MAGMFRIVGPPQCGERGWLVRTDWLGEELTVFRGSLLECVAWIKAEDSPSRASNKAGA